MKKTLYLECNSGISGDMTVGALLDLGADRKVLEDALASLGVDGYHLHFGTTEKCGIKAYDFDVHLELKSSFKLQDFVATIRKLGIRIDDIEANPAYLNSGLSVYTVSLTVDSQELKKDKKHSDIIEALRSLDYIYYIEEIK